MPADVPINAPKGSENGTQHLKGLTIYVIRRIRGYIEPPFVNCMLSGKVEDDTERRNSGNFGIVGEGEKGSRTSDRRRDLLTLRYNILMRFSLFCESALTLTKGLSEHRRRIRLIAGSVGFQSV